MISIPIIAVSGGFIVAIIAIVTEHNRKKKLIEKVHDISDNEKIKILSDITKNYPSYHDDSSLKFGALLIGIGIGLLAGGFIYYRLDWVPYVWLAYLIGASIIGGLALVLVYFYNKRNKKT